MIHIGIWLLTAGVGAAVLRARARGSRASGAVTQASGSYEIANRRDVEDDFDDVAELRHYRGVAAYGLVLGLAGRWFFPPASLLSLPLTGYSALNYCRTLKHSSPNDRFSAMALFESIGAVGTILSGHFVMSSVVLLTGFSTRSLMLHIGNIAHNHDPGSVTKLRQQEAWVLRDGAELQMPVSALKPSDLLVINSGDVVPVSGKVLKGSGQASQFSLEKRMKLVSKEINDKVHQHTKLHSGNLLIKPDLPG